MSGRELLATTLGEDGEAVERFRLRDDLSNADRFASDHEHRLRHVDGFAPSWLIWDGKRWAQDETRQHVELAKETADALWQERANDPDTDWRKHASNTRRAGRIAAMVSLASSDPRLARRVADFDCDPWLLNTESGTVDLRTGDLRPHDPADGITMVAGGSYRPDASAPTWQAFLERILGSDDDLEAFLRRLAGASAIGLVRDHILAILWGSGANGKSTFVKALGNAFGEREYAHTAPVSLLVGNSGGGATPDLADLRGRRFVTVSETREDGELSVERVKSLTGGDTVSARHLYAAPFSFAPSHTCWLSTNHRPKVGDDGGAIWRRLLLIPFAVTIPKAEWDLELDERLKLEVDGIIAWIVRGALEYAERGIDPPARVLAATNEYRSAESTFAAWIEEALQFDRNAWTSSKNLRDSYLEWARHNDAEELSSRAIAARLGHRSDLEAAKGTAGVRGWKGLRVKGAGS